MVVTLRLAINSYNGATFVFGLCLDLFISGGRSFVHLD